MATRSGTENELTTRLVEWIWRAADRLCETIEPWEHGLVYRASRYPAVADLNSVRVQGDCGMAAEALMSFADRALADSEHRCVTWECASAAEPLRAAFARHGYVTLRHLWMHFEGVAPTAAPAAVREVAYDAVNELRVAWHAEDFPGQNTGDYLNQVQAARTLLGARVLAVHDGPRPVGFAGLDLGQNEAEIGALYVLPEYRGRGIGTALARAAIAGTRDCEHLWICADDEGRPQRLYARLGFAPVRRTAFFLRLPGERPISSAAQAGLDN